MTDEKMALLDLVEQASDSDFVREMLAFAAERLMDMEVEARTGAPLGARSASRSTQRNGATAIAPGVGARGRARSNWRSRSCARAATSRPFSNHGRLRKRRCSL
jgi:hypothetical protein